MYETRYHRPASLAEAVSLFADAEEARYLAGGQTLIPVMKQRLAAPSDVIDLALIDDLKGVSRSGDVLTIGACVTHAEVAASDAVRDAIPALSELAGMIGDPAVRHRGTLGGSLANNDPAADYPAAALALGATIHTDKRALPVGEFLTGLFDTALDEGELVVRVDLPIPTKAAYRKFGNPASRYAMAGAFVAVMADSDIRVAISGAGDEGAFRADAMEQALSASFTPDALDAVAVSADGLLSDIHGSAAYRANLVRVMAKRAVADIAG